MIQVNYLGIVVASVAAMGVGYAWYSNLMFGKRWMKLEGLSENTMNKSGMGMKMGIMFLTTLISAYILSLFIHYGGAYTLFNGVKTGFWAWVGFVMPTGLAHHLFSRKPLELFLIQTGHHLTAFLIMGGILAWMW